MNMRSVLFAVLAVLPAVTALGQKVETKYDHSIDFQKYRTYGWREHKIRTHQIKEDEELIKRALVEAVDAQLRAKGLAEDQSAPDLYVTFNGGATVSDSKAGAAYSPNDLRGYGAGNVWTSNSVPGSVPNLWVSMQGVLLFEIIDAKTDSVVWSSLLRKKIRQPGKMPSDLDKAAAEIVQKAFRDFPLNTTQKKGDAK